MGETTKGSQKTLTNDAHIYLDCGDGFLDVHICLQNQQCKKRNRLIDPENRLLFATGEGMRWMVEMGEGGKK